MGAVVDRHWDTQRQEWVYPPDWRQIDKATPKDKSILLYFPKGVWCADENVAIGFWSTSGEDWFASEADSKAMTAFGENPTHWMYLPEPPE